MLATAPSKLYGENANGTKVLVVWGGTNDLASGSTPLSVWNTLSSYAAGGKAAGYKVVVVSMISRVGLDAQKNALNSLIYNNWPGIFDGLADVAGNPNLGADGAYANLLYFGADGTHPTTLSDQTIVAPIIQASFSSLL